MEEQNFTEKTAVFKGEWFNMRGFLNSGIHYASKKKISEHIRYSIATITWICEDPKTDIHDLINIEQMELWGIKLLSINNDRPKKPYLCALCDGVPCHKDCEDCNK